MVARNYGRAELTLLDFVKARIPEVTSIDVLRVGQRLKLPALEPGAGGEDRRVPAIGSIC